MKTEKESLHQQIMEETYARWKKHDEWEQEDFWSQLSRKEKFAVFSGNFNYQVNNGGFAQWKDNGYAKKVVRKLLIEELDRMDTKLLAPLLR